MNRTLSCRKSLPASRRLHGSEFTVTPAGNTHHVAALGRAVYGAGSVVRNGAVVPAAEAFAAEGLVPLAPVDSEWRAFAEGNEVNAATAAFA